jgi:hypothetical protein
MTEHKAHKVLLVPMAHKEQQAQTEPKEQLAQMALKAFKVLLEQVHKALQVHRAL